MAAPLTTCLMQSNSYDPWHNLALEDLMTRQVPDDTVILYLWQNQNTVVIGRNQNAWKECHCQLLEQEGGKLARRLSGGGAVFHDLGNLNFTFIMNRKFYELQKQLDVILQAVQELGINAAFSGRNDLVADCRKFSGNAFYFDTTNCYHHGTILVDADFSKLSRYLQVSREKIVTKGIDSVRSRVVNLREINPSLTINDLATSLHHSFASIYGTPEKEFLVASDTAWLDLSKLPGCQTISPIQFDEQLTKYGSWEWRYGATPKFDVSFETRFPWGGIEMALQLTGGHIVDAKVYSDAMDSELIHAIGEKLLGLPFGRTAIAERINSMPGDHTQRTILTDIASWLNSDNLD